jgi:hypothetical protein
MKTPTNELTPKQQRVLAALLAEVTQEGAASRAGVSVATLWRFLQDPAFQRQYLSARRQVVEDAIGLLQRASRKAVATLVRNLDCGQAGVEVRAAQIILEQSYKGVEMLELEARIAHLEENLPAVSQQKPAGRGGYG